MTRLAATGWIGSTMQALTDFADLAVVLPVALCVGLWLAVSGWADGARYWLVAFGAVLAVTALLKLGFLGCAPADSPVSSPSGHTASASFVYGGIATLALRAGWRSSAVLGIAAAVLVGVSRVAVHAHSGAEAILGGAVGVAALVLFAWRAVPVPRGLRFGRLLLVCFAVDGPASRDPAECGAACAGRSLLVRARRLPVCYLECSLGGIVTIAAGKGPCVMSGHRRPQEVCLHAIAFTRTGDFMLHRLVAVCAMACAVALPAAAQTSKTLKHQPPAGAGIGFLLTDGTAIFQANNLSDWYKLTPDNTGSYQNGSWTKLASLPSGYVPDAFASAVLADGRVVIAGGEYNNGNFALTDLCAIYDPAANTWTAFNAPAGWDYIGDSPSSVLPDGRFLLGRKLDKRIAALDPATLTWTELSSKGKKDFNAEEGWTLMPNGTVLTYDVKAAPNSEIYNVAVQRWKSAGSTIVALNSPPAEKSITYGPGLVYHPPGEVGPGILRPDGTVFATGGTPKGANSGNTAIFTPKGASGTWAAGPSFPSGDDAGDSFAALLPNGNVLVEGESGRLYEFNGSTLTPEKFSGNGGSLLVLPTGENSGEWQFPL